MQVNCIVIHATKSSNICINITFFINVLYARYVDVIFKVKVLTKWGQTEEAAFFYDVIFKMAAIWK